MPVTAGILQPDGLRDNPCPAISLTAALACEMEGIYTNARTYQRIYALLLDAHLDRMEESAQMEGIPLNWDRAILRQALRTLIDRSGYDESRFRITVPAKKPDHIYITLEPLQRVPPELLENGVHMATASVVSRDNPRSKTTDWVTLRAEAARKFSDAIYEGLLVSPDGKLLEGFSSNFYAIKDGVLYTANQNILIGITRKIVLEVAPPILPVQLQSVKIDEIPDLDEAFLTSSSRGIVPVTQIDDRVIGRDKPGPLTRRLMSAFDAWVNAHITRI